MKLGKRILELTMTVMFAASGIVHVNAQEMEILSMKQQAIIPIAALTAKGDTERLKTAISEGLEAGLTVSEIKEVMTHLYAYTGFPRSLNALTTFMGVLDGRKAAGTNDAEGRVLSAVFERKYPMAEPINDVFPRGEVSTMNYFTGEVYNQRLVSADETTPCQASNVTFSAGARTRWHVHTGTQILLCTAGRGWYQEKGQSARELKPGDAVNIRPGVVHWHGAAYDSEFSHVSVIPNPAGNKDTWLEPVDEAEYRKLH